LIQDIEKGHQYKLLLDETIAAVFSITYQDPLLWREREKGDAIYIHRMVANSACRGQKLFGKILEFTKQHAIGEGKTAIRMDTWAANQKLIGYYETHGFRFVEHFTTPDIEQLPIHNRNLMLTLLEYGI